jgi:hypothetical protein
LTRTTAFANLKIMGSRRAALLFALAALFFNSLDCYGAWLTSSQARACCRMGHCSRSHGDPCCKVSVSLPHQALQPQEQISLQPQLTIAPVSVNSHVFAVDVQPYHLEVYATGLAPPAGPASKNLPLLI